MISTQIDEVTKYKNFKVAVIMKLQYANDILTCMAFVPSSFFLEIIPSVLWPLWVFPVGGLRQAGGERTIAHIGHGRSVNSGPRSVMC